MAICGSSKGAKQTNQVWELRFLSSSAVPVFAAPFTGRSLKAVRSVVKGGPAENAGIAASDVITKFDGQDVSSMASLQSMLEYYKKGEQVKVTIEYRDGREYKTKDVTVTLGDKSVIETTQNAAN